MDGLTYHEWRAKVESFRQKYIRAEKAYPNMRGCWFRFSYPDRVSAEENCNHAAAFLQTIPNVVHAARFIAGSVTRNSRIRVYWCSLFGDVQDGVERFQRLTDTAYRTILACPKPVRDTLNAVMPDWLLGGDSLECGPGANSLFTPDRTANHMIWMTRMANLRRARPDADLAIEHNTIYPGPTVPNQLTGSVERREYEPFVGGSIFNFPMELINEPQSIDTKKRTALATYAGPVVKCWSFVNSVWSASIAATEAILSAADSDSVIPRDKWLYEQCCAGVAFQTIVNRLKKKNWELIETVQGVKKAAARYAKLHDLPEIPKRQSGRPAK